MPVYIGVDGTACKVTKMYVGVNNIAQKVKRAYVGVNGVAQLFYASEKRVEYKGRATQLSVARNYACAETNGVYAIVAGGYDGSSARYSNADCYNSALTHTTASGIVPARAVSASARVANYILFVGGYSASGQSASVDAYDATLTRRATQLSVSRDHFRGGSVGEYALFAGGQGFNSAEYFNSTLTRGTATSLSAARQYSAAASVGQYLIFAGGDHNSRYSAAVDAYNQALTRTVATDLSTPRSYLTGMSVGDYALICGGYTGSASVDIVDAYNSALTRTIATPLKCTQFSYVQNATTLDDFALISGGATSDSRITTCYNSALTRIDVDSTDTDASIRAATTIGNYALFAGGGSSTVNAVVNIYGIE